MDTGRALGEFLQTRRAQLLPADVGLSSHGERRRVPGLRREELALLAGVSLSYYSRLEQDDTINASPEVLNAIAQVLQLNEAERQHLHALASGNRRRPATRRPAPERATPAVIELLAAVADVPALVLGWRGDVLAWNPMGHALFGGHLPLDSPQDPARRPNMVRLVFTDAHTRDLYTDWPAKARAVVGTLRLAAGQHPDDARLAALVGELTVNDPHFSAMWADHGVKAGSAATSEMRHPLVGAMQVTQQTLQADNGQHLIVATTAPGSPSQQAMSLLAHALATRSDPAKDQLRRSSL